MRGERDMARHLPAFGIPDDLSGRKVLDVGTASGYFAIEFARRGADVTAIDLWDGSFQREVFRAARVKVRYLQMDLFDVDASFGSFDLVFCGSVLMHVWDQFEALRRLRSVCRDEAIVSTAIMRPRLWRRRRRLARLAGDRATSPFGEPYWFTWELSLAAFVALLQIAGFERAAYRGSFRSKGRVGVVQAFTH